MSLPATLTADAAAGPPPGPAAAVAPLAGAVAAGTARFGTSPIVAAPAKGLTRLQARLGGIFAAFPAVTTTGSGIKHATRSGLYFADLRLGGGNYLAGLGATTGPPLRPGQPLLAVTGRCMFGFGAITTQPGEQNLALLQQNSAFVDPATPIETITVDARPHIYEAEGTDRAGGFLRDLAAVPLMGPVHVRVHVPVTEYQLHGLHLYSAGLMSAAAYKAYRAAIRDRGRMLTGMLAARLGRHATLTAVSPLGWVHEVLDWDKPGNDPGRFLWDAATSQPRSRTARRLWRILAALRPDDSLVALSHASYSHAYLATAEAAARDGHALVLAEDPEEEPLFRHTWAAADAASVPLRQLAVGFYLHPQLAAMETAPGSDGYYLYNVPDGCNVTAPLP